MRIKIQSVPPLTEIKGWLSTDAFRTISDLRVNIVKRLHLNDGTMNGILLLLDDFPLFDDSTIDVLRDGDLVVVQQSKKRKRSSSPKVARQFSSHPSVSGRTSSSTSSASEDESGTSDSDSSASSDSEPDEPPQKSVPQSLKPSMRRADHDIASVPPGQGKAQTQARNKRRRLKRMYDKQQHQLQQPLPPLSSSLANSTPLGIRKPSAMPALAVTTRKMPPQVTDTIIDDPRSTPAQRDALIPMASLRSKNKNKNKKSRMSQPGQVPPRIVFDDAGDPAVQQPKNSDPAKPGSANLNQSNTCSPTPYLIPPSERTDLPSNLFVTSVDVEEGMWGRKGKKSRQVEQFEDESNLYSETVARPSAGTSSSLGAATTQAAQDDGELEYPNSNSRHSTSTSAAPLPKSTSFDWTLAESAFARSTQLSRISQLSIGSLVAWSELAINPKTFQPEFLLTFARVVDIPPSLDCIVITKLLRPGEREISFSSRAKSGGVENQAGEGGYEAEMEMEEETRVGWEDVARYEWRAVEL